MPLSLLYLLMWVDVDVTLDALLSHVGPGVATHPLPLTFGAFVFPKAPLLALIRGQAFTFGPSLDRNAHHIISEFAEALR